MTDPLVPDPFPLPAAAAPALEGAELQAGRNILDQQFIEQTRLGGQPRDLMANELLPKLRFRDPAFPTTIETSLITTMRAAFPALAADFNSYQQKPTGCGCAGKIRQALMQAPDKTQAALDHVYGAAIYKFIPLSPTPSPSAVRGQGAATMIGQAYTIDATPAAWTAHFAQLLKTKGFGNTAAFKLQYNGVSVQPTPDGKKWVLLFY